MIRNDMKTIVFSPKGIKVLHIELPGCIVNITVNLTNEKDQQVTHIEVLPDQYVGEEWHLAANAPKNIRVVKGKK